MPRILCALIFTLAVSTVAHAERVPLDHGKLKDTVVDTVPMAPFAKDLAVALGAAAATALSAFAALRIVQVALAYAPMLMGWRFTILFRIFKMVHKNQSKKSDVVP